MKVASVRHNNFDLLRLGAASQVVWDHASTHLGLPTPIFAAAILHAVPGVPIFFVISGFLISMSYERSQSSGNTAKYYLNRFLRIYPALWVALFVGIVTVVVFGSPSFYNAPLLELIKWVFAQSTVVQFDNPNFLRHYGVGVLNGSLWTIPVELEFYILLPLLYALLRLRSSARGNLALAISLAFCLVIRTIFTSYSGEEHALWYKLVKVSLAPYLYVFLLGVLLQRNMRMLRPFLVGKATGWVAGYAIACAIAVRSGWVVSGNELAVPLMVLLALTIVSCAYSAPALAERVLLGRDLSYGTYVYHMLVVNVFVQLGMRGSGWSTGVLVFVVVYALAFLSWTWIEAPALGLRTKISKMSGPLGDAV